MELPSMHNVPKHSTFTRPKQECCRRGKPAATAAHTWLRMARLSAVSTGDVQKLSASESTISGMQVQDNWKSVLQPHSRLAHQATTKLARDILLGP